MTKYTPAGAAKALTQWGPKKSRFMFWSDFNQLKIFYILHKLISVYNFIEV